MVQEDEKRPLVDGFPSNLAYFRLDFLDKDRVALRRAFREILPLLWLKSGAIGPRPALPTEAPEPALFVPPGNAFAVLLDESRLAELTEVLAGRTDLRMLSPPAPIRRPSPSLPRPGAARPSSCPPCSRTSCSAKWAFQPSRMP